jgi:hypothetical protein
MTAHDQPPPPGRTKSPSQSPAGPAILRSLTDSQVAITMLTQADDAARRVARQMCHDGITQAERAAIYDFLHAVANYVRWPNFQN